MWRSHPTTKSLHFCPRVEQLETRVVPTTFRVDDPGLGADLTPGDGRAETAEGTTTLVAAIQEANANASADTIIFALQNQEIDLEGQRLAIVHELTIDGGGQRIRDGAFDLTGGEATIRNLELIVSTNFDSVIKITSDRNTISGTVIRPENLIGTEQVQGDLLGGLNVGIEVNHQVSFPGFLRGNQIGIKGAKPNVIVNAKVGIKVSGNGLTRIERNELGILIEADAPNETGILNESRGTVIIGGNTDDFPANVIVNSLKAGIDTIQGSVRIQGNHIGVLADGQTQAGNNRGIQVGALAGSSDFGSVHIGQDDVRPLDGQTNVISGNLVGIEVGANATSVAIVNNLIGTDQSGLKDVGNSIGVHIEGGTAQVRAPIGRGAGNLISGNRIGISIGSGATGATITGNRIGTDFFGVRPLGNFNRGIEVRASNVLILDNLIASNGTFDDPDPFPIGGIIVEKDPVPDLTPGSSPPAAPSNLRINGNSIGAHPELDVGSTLGNNGFGIFLGEGVGQVIRSINGQSQVVGQTNQINNNVIAFSLRDGIRSESAGPDEQVLGNDLRDNLVFSNRNGVDLVTRGQTGPGIDNEGFPTIVNPTLTVLPDPNPDLVQLRIDVENAPPRTRFEIDIFEPGTIVVEAGLDAFREGRARLTEGLFFSVLTNANGVGTAILRHPNFTRNKAFTAQITNLSDQTTSEFTQPVLGDPLIGDLQAAPVNAQGQVGAFQGVGIRQRFGAQGVQVLRTETEGDPVSFRLQIVNESLRRGRFLLKGIEETLFRDGWELTIESEAGSVTSATIGLQLNPGQAITVDITLTPRLTEDQTDVFGPIFELLDGETGQKLDEVQLNAIKVAPVDLLESLLEVAANLGDEVLDILQGRGELLEDNPTVTENEEVEGPEEEEEEIELSGGSDENSVINQPPPQDNGNSEVENAIRLDQQLPRQFRFTTGSTPQDRIEDDSPDVLLQQVVDGLPPVLPPVQQGGGEDSDEEQKGTEPSPKLVDGVVEKDFVKLIDPSTGEVLERIPSEEFLFPPLESLGDLEPRNVPLEGFNGSGKTVPGSGPEQDLVEVEEEKGCRNSLPGKGSPLEVLPSLRASSELMLPDSLDEGAVIAIMSGLLLTATTISIPHGLKDEKPTDLLPR